MNIKKILVSTLGTIIQHAYSYLRYYNEMKINHLIGGGGGGVFIIPSIYWEEVILLQKNLLALAWAQRFILQVQK